MPIYEKHDLKNKKLPVIFNHSSITQLVPREEWGNWHDNIEFIFVVDGAVDARVDGVERRVESGSTVIINANSLHTIGTFTYAKYYCLIVDRSFCLENYFDTSKLYFERCVHDEELFALFEKFKSAYEQIGKVDFMLQMARAYLLQILALVCRKYSSEQNENEEASEMRFIRPALEYIYLGYSDCLSLDEIAHKVGVSKYHFARSFKKAVGCTFIEYLNRVRCREAKRMLTDTDTSVREVGKKCGFSSPAYFGKIFKENEGVSPSLWRSQSLAAQKKKGQKA